jgi:hypothetical protein
MERCLRSRPISISQFNDLNVQSANCCLLSHSERYAVSCVATEDGQHRRRTYEASMPTRIDVPTSESHPFIILPTCIDNKGPLNFVLDAGANVSLVSEQLARRLDIWNTGITPHRSCSAVECPRDGFRCLPSICAGHRDTD